MTTKTELLELLKHIQYADFFDALDKNNERHHSLSKLRKDFIYANSAYLNQDMKNLIVQF